MRGTNLSEIACRIDFTLFLVFAGFSLAGCLPLLIPGLAYSGYQTYRTTHQSQETVTAAVSVMGNA